jgi:hypothetical protein
VNFYFTFTEAVEEYYCLAHYDLIEVCVAQQKKCKAPEISPVFKEMNCRRQAQSLTMQSRAAAEHNRCLVNHHARPLQAKRAEQVAAV